MVANGLALAYLRYSLDYVEEEADAREAQRGIWASEFVKPWEWRRGKRIAANDNTPGQCRNLDIYRSANLLVKRHAQDAPPRERRHGC